MGRIILKNKKTAIYGKNEKVHIYFNDIVDAVMQYQRAVAIAGFDGTNAKNNGKCSELALRQLRGV
jgi:hypothetical protein